MGIISILDLQPIPTFDDYGIFEGTHDMTEIAMMSTNLPCNIDDEVLLSVDANENSLLGSSEPEEDNDAKSSDSSKRDSDEPSRRSLKKRRLILASESGCSTICFLI